MAATYETDAVIVGGGPTGLTASILLSRHGVRSLLVERRPGTSTIPRARGVHRRTMEILRSCGVAGSVYAAQYEMRPERVWSQTLSAPIERREVISAGEEDDALSPCRFGGCAQDVLEPILRDHAASHPGAEVRFGWRLESFVQDAGGVEASIVEEATGETATVRARYMVAADGPASPVREACGIPMRGPDHLSDKLNLLFRSDLRQWVSVPPPLLHFVSGAVVGTFVANGPGGRFQFDVDLEPGMWADDSDFTDAARIIRAGIGIEDHPLEVLGAMPWRTAARVADHYRCGRVFIAGDAAHRLTPMGGMGISTGIHDVHNLAWKLALVLSGRAGDALLQTYEAERRPVGAFNVDYSLRMWRGESSGERLTDVDLGQVYVSDAVIGDTPAPRSTDPTGLIDVGPGVRAPHLMVGTPDGVVSTLDLFEREFVLLCAPGAERLREARAAEARERRVPLSTFTIDDPAWAERYRVSADGAVLVRPDGIIAWRGREAVDVDSEPISIVLGKA